MNLHIIEQLSSIDTDRIVKTVKEAMRREKKADWRAAVKLELAPLLRAGQDTAHLERALTSIGERLRPGESYGTRVAALLDELARLRLLAIANELRDPGVQKLLDQYAKRVENEWGAIDEPILSEVQRMKLAISQTYRRQASHARSQALKARHEAGWIAIERGNLATDPRVGLARYEEARIIFLELTVEDPITLTWKRSHFFALALIQETLSAAGFDLDRSNSLFEQAKELSEQISYQSWLARDWNDDLFFDFHNQADIEYLKGNFESAATMYKRLLDTAESSRIESPDDVDKIERILVLNLKMGDTRFEQGRFAEAASSYREVVRIVTGTVHSALTQRVLRESLVAAFGRLATALARQGDGIQSTEVMTEAISLVDGQIAATPEAVQPKVQAIIFLVRKVRFALEMCTPVRAKVMSLLNQLPERLRGMPKVTYILRELNHMCS